MNKEKVLEQIDGIVGFARRFYNEGHDFSPMFELVLRNKKDEINRVVLVLADYETTEKRFEIIEALGKKVAKGVLPQAIGCTPEGIFTASEAWVSIYPKDVDMNKMPMPRNDPNRKEMFIIAASTIEGENYFKALEIKRGDKIELIESKEASDWESMDNRLHKRFWDGYFSILPKT